jgi:hypothetical protein
MTLAEFKLQEMEETVSIKRRYNYIHDEDKDLMLSKVCHYLCKRSDYFAIFIAKVDNIGFAVLSINPLSIILGMLSTGSAQ